MKIMIVMPLGEQRGGGELTLLHLMQQGQNMGISWLVIFLVDGPMVTQIRALGVEVFVVPGGRMREIHVVMRAIFKIASIARREKADLIFSWLGKAHLYSSLAAILAGKPALWFQQGLPSKNSRVDRLATLLPAAGIFTCSQTSADAQAALSPKRQTVVVYPGVELERFDPTILSSSKDLRSSLGLPPKGAIIGIVGRFQRWKGIHVLIEAMPTILEKHPDTTCVVVGGKHSLEAEYPDFIDERIAALGLKNRVVLAGMQSNVQEWMQAMDIVVHASDREPFGLVVIEAMALGKPVIAGDSGGPTEIITNGINGLLAPYGDSDALAKAVIRYLDDPQYAGEVGVRARIRAQEFSTQHFANSFVKAIREVLPN